MKTLVKAFVLCTLTCVAFTSRAQIVNSSRPTLFKNVSASFAVTTMELDKAFIVKEGSQVQLNFANNFTFSGVVVSSVQRYGKLSNIIIKSPNLHNTLLSISRRVNDDNSVSYVGRILNEGYADGYELKQGSDGKYAFHKIKTEDLIQDY
ncbi:MAG: hypothetical protein ABI683_10015 [Ginsengibacter sp.]